MSTVTLAEAKQYLRVIHDDDDTLIQDLIDGAEREARAFLAHDSLEVDGVDSSEPQVPHDVLTAIKLLVRADYEAADAAQALAWRQCAELKMWPYRQDIGV
jgi:hypothetical protein